jgi:hypothetical protein
MDIHCDFRTGLAGSVQSLSHLAEVMPNAYSVLGSIT